MEVDSAASIGRGPKRVGKVTPNPGGSAQDQEQGAEQEQEHRQSVSAGIVSGWGHNSPGMDRRRKGRKSSGIESTNNDGNNGVGHRGLKGLLDGSVGSAATDIEVAADGRERTNVGDVFATERNFIDRSRSPSASSSQQQQNYHHHASVLMPPPKSPVGRAPGKNLALTSQQAPCGTSSEVRA